MLHHAAQSLRTRAAIAVLASAAVLTVPVSVVAREAVDPASLTPPPSPAANPQCGWAGNQVICHSDLRFTVTDAPTGIFCDGGELLESSERHTSTQRFYNADLQLTKRMTHEWIDGILYVPATGELVHWTGTDLGISILRVPGDPSTGTGTNSGAIIHLHLADGRSISIAGRTIENFDTGAFTQMGSHPDGVDLCAVIA